MQGVRGLARGECDNYNKSEDIHTTPRSRNQVQFGDMPRLGKSRQDTKSEECSYFLYFTLPFLHSTTDSAKCHRRHRYSPTMNTNRRAPSHWKRLNSAKQRQAMINPAPSKADMCKVLVRITDLVCTHFTEFKEFRAHVALLNSSTPSASRMWIIISLTIGPLEFRFFNHYSSLKHNTLKIEIYEGVSAQRRQQGEIRITSS